MRCVILQPSFLPWRGYFDLIRRADVFVFYDDVQYDKHGWRNRNRIKTSQGPRWITVPVLSKGACRDGLPVGQVRISYQRDWRRWHLRTLRQAYARAPHLKSALALVQRAYERTPQRLAELTVPLTVELASALGLGETTFVRSSELGLAGQRTERLVRICQHLGADRYMSGPAAQAYIQPELFADAGIALEYIRYEYAEYPQLHPPYDPRVSVLDLLMMVGPRAASYL